MNLVLSKTQQLQQNGNSQFVSVICDIFDNYYNRKATNFESSVNKRFLNFVAKNDLYLTYFNRKSATRQNLSLRQIEPFLQQLGVKSKKQYISALNKLTKVLHSENIVKVVSDPHEKHKRDIDLILSEWLETIDFDKTKQTYKNAFVSFDKYVNRHIEGSQILETQSGAMVNIFTSKNAEGWKQYLLSEGKSIYTINCWLSALKSFCRFTSTRDEVFNLPSDQREQVIRELNRIRDIKNIKLDTNPEHEKGAFTR